jgi:hypothetical protein
MKRKWKYLSERKSGDYRYVRDFPTNLLRTFPSHPKQFSRELGLSRSCSDSQLHGAMEEATRLYELRVKMVMNSDPTAFSESERRLAVDEVLRQRQLKPGEYAHVPESQYTAEEWERAMQHNATIVPDRYDLAEWAIPEIDDIGDDLKRGSKLTFQQEVYFDAWKSIQELPKFKKTQTMREAWARYVADKGIDVTTVDGKNKQQRFERVIKYTGDFIISQETRDDVQDRIQNFIHCKRQENPGIKAQSLKRELAEFIAAIRYVPRIDWGDRLQLSGRQNNFQIPDEEAPVQGRNLSDEELRLFFSSCINKPDEKWTALLLAAHAGLGITEIRRLRVDQDLFLDAKYPHILFRGGDEGRAKTDSRLRVVPIVIGLEVIKEYLPRTIEWLNRINQKSPTNSLNKRLRALLGKEMTVKSHMFRHTWLRLSRRARISEDNKHAIAGWEKGDTNNTIMERVYDRHGYSDDPELLKQLYEDQQAIFSRFLADLSTLDNVVQLRK